MSGVLDKISGHATDSMFDRYNIQDEKDLAAEREPKWDSRGGDKVATKAWEDAWHAAADRHLSLQKMLSAQQSADRAARLAEEDKRARERAAEEKKKAAEEAERIAEEEKKAAAALTQKEKAAAAKKRRRQTVEAARLKDKTERKGCS